VLATAGEEQTWLPRRAAHVARVDGWLQQHRERRSRAVKHPVEDFLFEYYNLKPSQLRRWHPGHGVTLSGAAADELLGWRGYVRVERGVTVDTAAVVAARHDRLHRMRRILLGTNERPGYFGCFGLHEWAMVYGLAADEVRHPDWPLRLRPDAIAEVVRDRGVRCGHFDAFRFFTPAARALNVLQPTREQQPEMEQPGCLHANMDLYKHAYQLLPLVPSELVADTFALARDIRVLDMRASPYDLTALGLEPVAIETAAGRVAYARAQRQFSERSAPLRQALIDVLDQVLTEVPDRDADRSG
jgi:hypothetical protein